MSTSTTIWAVRKEVTLAKRGMGWQLCEINNCTDKSRCRDSISPKEFPDKLILSAIFITRDRCSHTHLCRQLAAVPPYMVDAVVQSTWREDKNHTPPPYGDNVPFLSAQHEPNREQSTLVLHTSASTYPKHAQLSNDHHQCRLCL